MICWLECETAIAFTLVQESAISQEGGHAVIEVFTTRQKCDGTENVGDSDAWLNRLLCTDCRVALWVVMPTFIVLKLKGSLIRELHYCTACSFWYSSTQNKDHVSKVSRFLTHHLVKLKMHCDRTLTKTNRRLVCLTSKWVLVHNKTRLPQSINFL